MKKAIRHLKGIRTQDLCANQQSYEAIQLRAGQFVWFNCFHEGLEE